MIDAVPLDYHRYGAVIARFDPVRLVGGGLTVRCPIGSRHRNGDAHPSCWKASAATGNRKQRWAAMKRRK